MVRQGLDFQPLEAGFLLVEVAGGDAEVHVLLVHGGDDDGEEEAGDGGDDGGSFLHPG